MSTIYRNRTIRPSSRLETSVSYKINTEKVTTMIHWLLPLTMKVKILIKNLLFQERRLQTVPQYTSDISMEKSFGHQFSLIRFISLQLLVNYQNFPVCNVYLIRLLILIETIAKKPFQRTFILILCFPHFTIIEN